MDEQREGGNVAEITDAVVVELNGEVQQVEVKGPDPDEWGEEHARMPEPVVEVASDYEVKGPDEFWHQAQAYADARQAARHQPQPTLPSD